MPVPDRHRGLVTGDHRARRRGRGRGDRGGGRARLAGLTVDGRGPSRAGPRQPRPGPRRRRPGAATEGLAIRPDAAGPGDPIRAAHAPGAARCATSATGQAGLLELQQAQAQLGGARLPTPLAAWAALLEHRAALLLGLPAAAATALEPAGRPRRRRRPSSPSCAPGAEAAAGSPRAARATVAPVLDGELRPALPRRWSRPGSSRRGRPCGRATGRPAARAVQAALDLAEPMDVVRPFAIAGRGVRVLLVDQLGGVRDPAAFAFRCLTPAAARTSRWRRR